MLKGHSCETTRFVRLELHFSVAPTRPVAPAAQRQTPRRHRAATVSAADAAEAPRTHGFDGPGSQTATPPGGQKAK